MYRVIGPASFKHQKSSKLLAWFLPFLAYLMPLHRPQFSLGYQNLVKASPANKSDNEGRCLYKPPVWVKMQNKHDKSQLTVTFWGIQWNEGNHPHNPLIQSTLPFFFSLSDNFDTALACLFAALLCFNFFMLSQTDRSPVHKEWKAPIRMERHETNTSFGYGMNF